LFKNFKMIRFSAFSPKLALGAAAALAAISLSLGSAQAFVVNVGGVQYDVTTFTGSFNDNTSKFTLPPAPGEMPWWGSDALALQFAAAVGDNLGFQTTDFGPFFGTAFGPGSVRICSVVGTAPFAVGVACGLTFSSDGFGTYARVLNSIPPPAAPVPGPLPALGAAAAFGFSRKLRKRIKVAPVALSSGLPQA
jgi:hypothetical protein